VLDIAGELSVNAVVQFPKLWHELQDMTTRQRQRRVLLEVDGEWALHVQESLAYHAFFFGRTALPGAVQVWNAFAPFKVQFHSWLALRNRCWTAERLAR
jgi:hypothetical protein